MTQAAILVGGRGTRLGALTANVPKPLLDVGGAPFLDVILRYLRRHGINRVLLLAGYQAEMITLYGYVAQLQFCIDVQISTEPEPAGTGGALWYARDRLEEEFLILNGDTLFNIDPRLLLDKLRATPTAPGVIAQRADGTGGGVYAMRREFITDRFHPMSSLEAQIAACGRIIRMTFARYFIDIGTPAELERARRELTNTDRDTYSSGQGRTGSEVHK